MKNTRFPFLHKPANVGLDRLVHEERDARRGKGESMKSTVLYRESKGSVFVPILFSV